MHIKPILRALGLLIIGEAVFMLPALIVSLVYREGDAPAFLISIGVLLAIGLPITLAFRNKTHSIYPREGFVIVGVGWMLLSVFGSLPFIFGGIITSPADAFFESVSGFTGTGASILPNVEVLAHGLLFWRAFTQWIGGMGVLVLTIALFPQLGIRNMEILRAESTGPSPGKISPRIRDTAKYLYFIYLGLSLILLILLGLTGMPFFDSITNMFATAGTGGFTVLNQSIGEYLNPEAEIIIGIFMLLFSLNFTVYFFLLARQFKSAFGNKELLFYGLMLLIVISIVTWNIRPLYNSLGDALRYALFESASYSSTTGFYTANSAEWPALSQNLMIVLMLIGGCAGSTAGGFKVVRVLQAGKAFRREMHLVLHPRIVRTVSMEGKPVTEANMRSVLAFFFIYLVIVAFACVFVSLDGFDFETTLMSVLSMVSNAGLGFGMVNTVGNYSIFSGMSKILLSICMLLGRLEVMPILLLFMPSMWRRL